VFGENPDLVIPADEDVFDIESMPIFFEDNVDQPLLLPDKSDSQSLQLQTSSDIFVESPLVSYIK